MSAKDVAGSNLEAVEHRVSFAVGFEEGKRCDTGATSGMERAMEAHDRATDAMEGGGQVTQPPVSHQTSQRTDSRSYIRSLSSMLLENDEEISVDQKRLSRALQDAGEDLFPANGAIEVWVLDGEETGMLKMPHGGWWRTSSVAQSDAVCRLDDLGLPQPVMAGVDLVGQLWSESVSPTHRHTNDSNPVPNSYPEGRASAPETETPEGIKRSSTFMTADSDLSEERPQTYPDLGSSWNPSRLSKSFDSRLAMKLTRSFDSRLKCTFPKAASLGQTKQERPTKSTSVTWRDLSSLLNDPDTPKSTPSRMEILAKAGWTQAAGVPFHVDGHQGLVVFLTTSEGEAMSLASNVADEVYMQRTAELVGSVMAASDARRASIVLRRERNTSNQPLAPVQSNADEESAKTNATRALASHAKVWARKCLGGNLQPPPRVTFTQSVWSLAGSFLSMSMLCAIDQVVRGHTHGNAFVLLGPMGALMTLQYGLTSAPASQPRNVVFGQAVAGFIGVVFTYLPDDIFPGWVRQAGALSVAVFAMSGLGLIHPPASASAVILAGEGTEARWQLYGILLLSSALSLVPATAINNMNKKRQYPTYWKLLPVR